MKEKYRYGPYVILILTCLFFSHASIKGQDEKPYEMVPVSEEAYSTMTQFFQYDKEIPLNARVIERVELPECFREKIVFSGSHNSRVPGFLAFPKTGSSPYPCILMLHGLDGGGKSRWWNGDSVIDLAVREVILTSGYAILALDAQYEGERKANNDYASAMEFIKHGWYHKLREMLVESTVDYRRALDYLETRNEIDTSRIGVFGYSMGGMMTFFLTGTDSRIKASVAAVTPLMGKKTPLEISEYANHQLSAITPRNYTRAINNRPFLMLMGEKDFYYTVDEAQQLFDLINSQTKGLIFYNSGHHLPIEYAEEVVRWFNNHL